MGGSSDGSVLISGGTLYVKASGDGIDANGTLEITGGSITVCGPTQGDTATLDYDVSGVINGGTFIGTGGGMMAQSFSDSKQGVIAVKIGNQVAGTKITLADASGKEVISATPELPFAIVILSSPDIEKGETYTITVGEEKESLRHSNIKRLDLCGGLSVFAYLFRFCHNFFKLRKEEQCCYRCCNNIADRFCYEYSEYFICKEVW